MLSNLRRQLLQIQGTLVALKKLNIDLKKYPRFDLTRTQLMELKRMKDLQNEHITRYKEFFFLF